MAEIKFNSVRMKEVLMRLTEIEEQLNNSITKSNEKIQELANNITGTAVAELLTKYQEYNVETLNENKSLIALLTDYLTNQINTYNTVEQDAETALSDIQNILMGAE